MSLIVVPNQPKLPKQARSHNYLLCVRVGNILVLSVCLTACLSVGDIIFEAVDMETSFGMGVHLDIKVEFEYQDQWIKVNNPQCKMLIV